jgi:tape measure domain-containing protein
MATRDLARLVVKLEAQTANYVRELDKANARLSRFEAQTKRALAGIDTAFKRLVTGAAVAALARSVTDLADQYTQLQNSLKVTGLEGQALSAVQDRLFASANRNGIGIGALAELYRRSSLSARELGASQEQLLQFVDGVTAALRLQGGSTAAASGALRQLSQALASGTVRSQEFTSILEGAQPIAQAVANGIERFRGSVASLRAAIANGQVTSQEFFQGFLRGSQDLQVQASRATLTISQSFTVLRNNLVQVVGEIAGSTGITNALSSAMTALATNIGGVIRALGVAAVAGATFAEGLAIARIVESTRAFFELFSAVASGRAILLNSAAAERARAAAALETAKAEAARTAAVLAAARAEQARAVVVADATIADLARAAAARQIAILEQEAAAAQEALNKAQLAAAASARGGTGALSLLRGALTRVLGPLRAIAALAAANPIAAIAAGVVAVIGSLVAFADRIKTSADGVVTLRDTAIAAWQLMTEALEPLRTAISNTFGPLLTAAEITFDLVARKVRQTADVIREALQFVPAFRILGSIGRAAENLFDRIQRRARENIAARDLQPVQVTASRLGTQIADPKALKSLKDLETALRQQIITSEQGAVATIRYRIAQGDLADEFKKAGAAAEPYRRSLVDLTAQIERIKIRDMVRDLRQQIDVQDLGAKSTLRYRIEQGDLKVTFDDLGASVRPLRNELLRLSEQQEALRIRDIVRDLEQQVRTYQASGTAVLKYRLSVGDLAATLRDAGAAGQQFAAQAIALQRQLDSLQVAEQLRDINAQILELRGNTVEAALLRFDTSNLQLTNQLLEQNNEAGREQLRTLRALTAAQAEYSALQTEAQRIQSQLAIAEERIRNNQQLGAINEIEALHRIGQAREVAAAQLDTILTKMRAIAAEAANPALIDGVEQFAIEVEKLAAQTNLLAERAETALKDEFASAFADIATGAKSAEDGIASFFDNLKRRILETLAMNFAERLFGGLSALAGGGGFLGTLGQVVGEIFGGARAEGGPVQPGKAYLVGERGPELMVPASAGNIVPASAMGGMNVTMNFTVQAPNGTVSRQTQQQIAAAAARGLAEASRRNN